MGPWSGGAHAGGIEITEDKENEMVVATTTGQAAKEAALRASPFGALTARQLSDVARLSAVRHFDAGQRLCRRGEFDQDLFVVVVGTVAVNVDGAEVARRGPGDVVGDWATFGDGHRSATVVACTGVDTLVVDPREVDSLLMAVPSAARALGPGALRPAQDWKDRLPCV